MHRLIQALRRDRIHLLSLKKKRKKKCIDLRCVKDLSIERSREIAIIRFEERIETLIHRRERSSISIHIGEHSSKCRLMKTIRLVSARDRAQYAI